jgi:hypothetical protein
MEKSRLINFIRKYHLNGLIQSVAWNSNESLSTRFISDDKSLVGEVLMHEFSGTPSKMGIYNTDTLIKLINVLGNDINFNVRISQDTPLALILDDNSTTVNFLLADLSVIPTSPVMKQLPEFQLTIKITKEFTDKFIRATSALSDSKHFTVAKNQKSNKYQVVLGYNDTNRIYLDTDCDASTDIDPISFYANHLREIIVANKDANGGSISISSEGLARVDFQIDGFETRYFLVTS